MTVYEEEILTFHFHFRFHFHHHQWQKAEALQKYRINQKLLDSKTIHSNDNLFLVSKTSKAYP